VKIPGVEEAKVKEQLELRVQNQFGETVRGNAICVHMECFLH